MLFLWFSASAPTSPTVPTVPAGGDQTGVPREAAGVSSRQAAQQPGGTGQEDHRTAETRREPAKDGRLVDENSTGKP